ncbi:hypothetical protein [Sphingomonas sp. PP-CE-1A-559]|uniref:hypothetical protein n=1 Tax=Sphingomonas sp. PP-CE-1A-559 TaxID=2135657 RepID=UPI001404E45E|nr:hypothetical protein [Sphingomonas sp. PP-CE-1A-559]
MLKKWAFTIASGTLEMHAPGACGGSGFDPHVATVLYAAFTCSSLTTIKATGSATSCR